MILKYDVVRVETAKAEQQAKLEDLIIFKGLYQETVEHFGKRLRLVFDNYVSHRRSTGIKIPSYPASCVETQDVIDDLTDLIEKIANEETFNSWLGANLDACCDDRYDDITLMIEKYMPMLRNLKGERDDILMFLHNN